MTESHLHIKLLELRAVRNVCSLFLVIIKDKTVQILIDNMPCMFYIDKGERDHTLSVWKQCDSGNGASSTMSILQHHIHLVVRIPQQIP